MKKTFKTGGLVISDAIGFFYPPFRKYMTLQFFQYGVIGSANLVFDWVLYFIIYTFVLQHKVLDLGFITVSSHIATLGVKFPIVLLSGFLLQKYVTFSYSDLRGRVQLFRYMVVFMINLIINYVGLKIFVDGFHVYPTLSNMIVSVFTVIVSYFSQKRYTFKASKPPVAKI